MAFPFTVSERPLFSQPGPIQAGVLLEAGIEKEDVDGDLKSAMEIYQRIAADNSVFRDVRARALWRLAGCDEKLGRSARQIYEQIVRDFAEQPAAVQARKRLADLARQEHPAPPATMSDRRIEWSRLGSMGPSDTDGKRAVFYSGDKLYLGDLAGRSRQLILNTKRYEWMPCKDFSLVALDLFSTPSRQHTLAVIKTDGTGYRSLIRDDAKNSIFEQDQSFAMNCSWDDRNILLSGFSLKSKLSGQLWVVAVADGQRRVLVDVKGWRIRKAVFSPDGRFAAYEVWPKDTASPRTSRVFVVPIEGGEPQLIYETAPWQVSNGSLALMDWTADGRYLILRDVKQGKSALYLVPMNDGAASGAPTFVRFGEFDEGYTTASGGFVYEDKSASPSNVDASISSLNAEDRFGDWRSVDLNTNGVGNAWPSFSPDGNQIAYIAQDADASRRDVMLRDLTTGQEHEIYRSMYGAIVCRFSSHNLKVFCSVEKEKSETDLISISVDSGAIEKVASFPGSRFLLAVTGDDQSFFFSGNAWLLGTYEPPLLRWDRSIQQETTVEPASEDRRMLSVSPDGRWVMRLLDGMISIRPMNGGDWRFLASGVTAKVPPFVSPDGKWVLYQTVDSTDRLGLFRIPITGGSPERLSDLPNNNSVGSFFFSPDGHKALSLAEKRSAYSLSVLENFVPSAKK